MNFNGLRGRWSQERVVKWFVTGLMAYWAIYALVVPVTVTDSNVYNLGRLLVMRDGGLFHNPLWNAGRQVFFPLGFDAIHYIFLFAGFGYALPSYACFLGTLLVVYQLVKEYCGTAGAWWCCLAMLAMPTLVFQGTTMKNDIPMLFGAACWCYALRFWLVRKQTVYLALMALALGFTAGAKNSGVPLFAVCGAWTFWWIRSSRRAMWQFAGFLFVSFILLGSVEIYINNYILSGHPLGRPSFVHDHKNSDGIPGAMASAVRYSFGLSNFGFETWLSPAPLAEYEAHLAGCCRAVLQFLHLTQTGYEPRSNDANFFFLKDQSEAGNDYGPMGMLAFICAFPTVFILKKKDIAWKLCAGGLVTFSIICLTVAWMPWNMRFLLVPMTCFALAFNLLLVREDTPHFYRWLRTPFLILLIYSVVVFPINSANKSPYFVWESIAHRDVMTTMERPEMLEIMDDIKALPDRFDRPLLLLHAGPDAWVLPILQIPFNDRRLQVMLAPYLTEKALKEAREKAAGRRIYILQLDREFAPETVPHLLRVRKYLEKDSSLFLLQQPSAQQ